MPQPGFQAKKFPEALSNPHISQSFKLNNPKPFANLQNQAI